MASLPLSPSAESSASLASHPLSHVPQNLRVNVLYSDESVVVIEKPCNLRSIPGHKWHSDVPGRGPADDIQSNVKNAGKTTAQEAWVAAIRTFSSLEGDDVVSECLRRLALSPTTSLACVPRKYKLFQRYLQQNSVRLLQKKIEKKKCAVLYQKEFRQVYECIRQRQQTILDRPEPTNQEESAFGQLILMGYGERDKDNDNKDNNNVDTSRKVLHCLEGKKGLFVVHRLDCETSGVMMFARNQVAASSLCRAWRERDRIVKRYLAKVSEWPLFQKDQRTEGEIDVPLAPSPTERLKWQVCEYGKPSTTLWKVVSDNSKDLDDDSSSILLSLTPVTGRTHQLRVHCAHAGGGIVGDSLYGQHRVEWNDSRGNEALCLHSASLSFPHPRTGELMVFESLPSWIQTDDMHDDPKLKRKSQESISDPN